MLTAHTITRTKVTWTPNAHAYSADRLNLRYAIYSGQGHHNSRPKQDGSLMLRHNGVITIMLLTPDR